MEYIVITPILRDGIYYQPGEPIELDFADAVTLPVTPGVLEIVDGPVPEATPDEIAEATPAEPEPEPPAAKPAKTAKPAAKKPAKKATAKKGR